MPDKDKPDSYGNNLAHSTFLPSKSAWAGDQREEAHFNFTAAISHAGHIDKAMLEPSHLAGAIPPPGAIQVPDRTLAGNSPSAISEFRGIRLMSLKRPIQSWSDSHALWNSLWAPPPRSGRLRRVFRRSR